MPNLVQLPSNTVHEQLVSLWSKTFGDPPEGVRIFYNHFLDNIELEGVADDSGRIVSAAHFLPVSYHFFRSDWKGGYLYAAMTDEAHRGRGMMSAIMAEWCRRAKERGDLFLCTLPAEESLYDYYGRFGMVPLFKLHRATVDRSQLMAVKLTLPFESKASPNFAYASTYKTRELTVTKDKCFVDYTALENEAVGGLFDSVCAGYYYARPMAGRGEDTVHVKEIYLAGDNFPHIAAALLRRYPAARQFVFDFCPGTVPQGFDYTEIKYGSARLLDAAEGLRRYAAKHRDLSLSLSVKDPLLEENTGDYLVKRGRVRQDPYTGTQQVMDIAELSRMVMTDGDAGHPYMNMMLD